MFPGWRRTTGWGTKTGLEVETKDAVLVTAQLGCVCVREEGSREGRRATRAKKLNELQLG